MSKPVTCGLLLPLVIKPEHTREWEEFVTTQGPPGVKAEPDTIFWFGTHQGSNNYGLGDLFTHEEGRKAHVDGPVAKAVFGHADWFAEKPTPLMFNVLAVKEYPKEEYSDNKAGVGVGLRVLLKAKQDKIDDVRNFLIGAVPLVDQEPFTIHWAAIEVPGTNVFGIIDTFKDEAGRQAHLNGKVAEALFANVDTLLEGPPDVEQTTILAANVN